LNHSAFSHGQSLNSLAAIRQQSSHFVSLLNQVDLNGMNISGYAIDLNMSVEVAARFFSRIFSKSAPVQYGHNELPIRMMHWNEGERSILMVFAQVGIDHTKGLLSTLDFNRIRPFEISRNENSLLTLPQDSSHKDIFKLLQQLDHKRLFMFQDQHVLAGFADLSTLDSTSTMYLEVLKSKSWVPISHAPGNLVMTKNGEEIGLIHHEDDTRTLSLFYSK
jgi:hypothetical protein